MSEYTHAKARSSCTERIVERASEECVQVRLEHALVIGRKNGDRAADELDIEIGALQ